MALLDIQRRSQQIGRLRMGQKVGTGKFNKDGTEKMRPVRRDTWRITTPSRYEAEAIAARFGGEVRPWEREFEVDTDVAELPVTVPPRDQVVSQNYEMWSAGGCLRRCNSQHEQISNGPCLCPHAEDPTNEEEVTTAALERSRLASLNPPRACKPITRISVMIPDLPGLGVFRLDTGSYYAAAEIGDAAALMQMARDKGVFLPAILRIEQRTRVANGQTKKFPVPVLEVLATFRDIATGAIEQQGIAAQLPPAPGEQRRAITSGQPAAQDPSDENRAQQIADLAAHATTREDVEKLAAAAKRDGVEQDYVTPHNSEVMEPLHDYLTDRWKALPPAGNGGES